MSRFNDWVGDTPTIWMVAVALLQTGKEERQRRANDSINNNQLSQCNYGTIIKCCVNPGDS